MITSHCWALSVLRTKPRRCAHQVKEIVLPRSPATSSASLFSKPCCCASENGRLFGSAHTRSSSAIAGRSAVRINSAAAQPITLVHPGGRSSCPPPCPSPRRRGERRRGERWAIFSLRQCAKRGADDLRGAELSLSPQTEERAG